MYSVTNKKQAYDSCHHYNRRFLMSPEQHLVVENVTGFAKLRVDRSCSYTKCSIETKQNINITHGRN